MDSQSSFTKTKVQPRQRRWIYAVYLGVIGLIWLQMLAGLPGVFAGERVNRPGIWDMLLSMGLPEGFSAKFRIGLDFGSLLVFTMIAGLLFWKRRDD